MTRVQADRSTTLITAPPPPSDRISLSIRFGVADPAAFTAVVADDVIVNECDDADDVIEY